MKDERYAGIDYSMTSPAICTHIGKRWDIRNCKFYYLTSVKKLAKKFCGNQFQGTLQPKKHKCDESRFDSVSQWAVKHCFMFDFVSIEGYAYSSTGQVFQIGENMGLLKHKLWESKTPFAVYAPTTIKKFATGKGNATKELMYESWLKETDINLKEIMIPNREKIGNPVSDIVDAYFIAKYHYFSELSDPSS
jgi:Holliday junction resolvasome RuvABC endonuclease subunit